MAATRSTPWLHLCLMSSVVCGCALEDPRQQGIVVLDREALASGAVVEQEPEVRAHGALPLLVDAERPVIVHNTNHSMDFTVQVGELVWVRGADLSLARGRLGQDFSADTLLVTGESRALQELAEQTSGRITRVGLQEVELGMADVWIHAAFAGVADIEQVRPVALDRSTTLPEESIAQTARTAFGAQHSLIAPNLAAAAAEASLAERVDPVGIYEAPGARLILDAQLGYTACDPELGAQSGRYEVVDDRVRLVPERGALLEFRLSAQGDLVPLGAGQTYALRGAEVQP